MPVFGIWGAPTSSIDWCETNYEKTRYVCEFYNTVSSAAMVLVGAVGLWLHRNTLERRFRWAFLAISVVGLGSIAFHATLRFECQMLDELPMLYTALVMLYILLEDRPESKFGPTLPRVLVLHGVVVSALAAFTRGRLQFYAFQLSFGSLELFALYRAYRIYQSTANTLLQNLFRTGMAAYAFAILCWFIDLKGCHLVSIVLPAHGIPNPQLHAVWHLLVSVGLYSLTLLLAANRLQTLGETPVLRRAGGVIPFIARGNTPAA